MGKRLVFGLGKRYRSGQVAMSLVFLIGAIMIIVGSILIFVVIGFMNSTYGFKASTQALSFASTGADDALLRLARDKNFTDALGYCVPSTACGAGTATVSVVQNSPSPGLVTIISSARVERRERKVKVVASVSTSTSEVGVVSWEITK